MFLYSSPHGKIVLLLYVDDIILTSSSTTLLCDFITPLQSEFSMKDLGDLSYFLGIHATRMLNRKLFLCQGKYARELLSKAKMTNCKVVFAPLAVKAHLHPDDGPLLSDPTMFRLLVGAL